MAIALLDSLASVGVAGADAIGRANLDGSGVQPGFIAVASPPSAFSVLGVAVDGRHIYWADSAAHRIGRASLDGTGVEPSFIAVPRLGQGMLQGPTSVAVDAGHIYWSVWEGAPFGSSTTYIGRASLDGTGVNPHFMTGAGTGIAVDRAHLYWGEGGAIGRANLDGTGVEHGFITGLESPFGNPLVGESAGSLAVDNNHIYWVALCGAIYPPIPGDVLRCGAAIGRANISGSGVQQSFIAHGNGTNVSLAVDGGHIYWSSSDANARVPPPDTIGRANLDGTNIERHFITLPHADVEALAVDAKHIYWSSSLQPQILSLQVTPRTFALTGRLVKRRCRPTSRANRTHPRCIRPIRLKITYTVNIPGAVMVKVQRRAAGRRVSGRCVAPSPRNRGNPTCTRLSGLGSLLHRSKAGENSFIFNGIMHTMPPTKLTPGSYQLTAQAAINERGASTHFQITP